MRAPSPAAGVVTSSSDIFSQLLLTNVQSVIADDLEIVGTVGQCTCGSPTCDGGSQIELTHDSGSGAMFGSPDAPPMILVENRASVPALMLTEDDIRVASVVTSAENRKGTGSSSIDSTSSREPSSTSASTSNTLPLYLGTNESVSANSSVTPGDSDAPSEDNSQAPTRHDRLVQSLSNTQNYYDTKYGAFNPFNTGL